MALELLEDTLLDMEAETLSMESDSSFLFDSTTAMELRTAWEVEDTRYRVALRAAVVASLNANINEIKGKGRGYNKGKGKGNEASGRNTEEREIVKEASGRNPQEGETGKERADEAAERPVLKKNKERHVTFNLELNTLHEITPYSEVYGVHPRLFNFDKHGSGMDHWCFIAGPDTEADTESEQEDDDDEEGQPFLSQPLLAPRSSINECSFPKVLEVRNCKENDTDDDQSTQLDSDDWGSVSDEEDEEEVMDWLTSPTLVHTSTSPLSWSTFHTSKC